MIGIPLVCHCVPGLSQDNSFTLNRRFATREALIEFARVLRPNAGALGFIWNIEDYNQTHSFKGETEWEAELRELNWAFTADPAPRFKDNQWRQVFLEAGWDRLPFQLPIHEKAFRETFWLTKEELWNRLNTLSNIVNQSDRNKIVGLHVRIL